MFEWGQFIIHAISARPGRILVFFAEVYVCAASGGGQYSGQVRTVPPGAGVYTGAELDPPARGKSHTGQEQGGQVADQRL